jgi:hypothetical protein
LFATARIEVTLCAAVIDPEVGRIAKPWGKRVSEHDDSAASFDCVFQADHVGLSVRLDTTLHEKQENEKQLPTSLNHPMYTPASDV